MDANVNGIRHSCSEWNLKQVPYALTLKPQNPAGTSLNSLTSPLYSCTSTTSEKVPPFGSRLFRPQRLPRLRPPRAGLQRHPRRPEEPPGPRPALLWERYYLLLWSFTAMRMVMAMMISQCC